MTASLCPKCNSGLVPCCPDCGKPVELYSRVVGYLRPVSCWNEGKQQEYNDRTEYSVRKIAEHQRPE